MRIRVTCLEGKRPERQRPRDGLVTKGRRDALFLEMLFTPAEEAQNHTQKDHIHRLRRSHRL